MEHEFRHHEPKQVGSIVSRIQRSGFEMSRACGTAVRLELEDALIGNDVKALVTIRAVVVKPSPSAPLAERGHPG